MVFEKVQQNRRPYIIGSLIALAVLGAAFIFYLWVGVADSLVPSDQRGSHPEDTEKAFKSRGDSKNLEFSKGDTKAAAPKIDRAIAIDSMALTRWNAVARKSNLQLIDSDSLDVSPATLQLLNLAPEKAIELNVAFRHFVADLKSEEIRRAYVQVSRDGGEEIIVPAFDRKKFVDKLRRDVGANIDPTVAAFVVEQLPFDRYLAVTNRPMRVTIERGEDGAERVVFSRFIRDQNAFDENVPINSGDVVMDPNAEIRTAGLLNRGINPRIADLFAAEAKLPRQELKQK